MDCGCQWEVAIQDGEIVGVNYEPEKANLNCHKVWELLCSGLTKGVFQLETPLGQVTAKACNPYGIEELADVISITRPGCLSGDTKVITRFGSNINQNGIKMKEGKYWFHRKTLRYIYNSKNRRDTLVSYNTDSGLLFHNTMNDIIYTGDKPVYEVIYSVGKSGGYSKSSVELSRPKLFKVRLTDDHKILTPTGWKPLKDFKQGDRFAIMRVHSNIGKNGYSGNYFNGEKAFRQNCWTNYEYKCIFCDWQEGSLDVNHIEGNRKTNNRPDNLCFMCPNHHRLFCEKKITIEEVLSARSKYILPQREDIFWAEYLDKRYDGVVDTYDVSMQGPYHNFIAGNIIVHNCGDSELDDKTLKQHYIDRKNGKEDPTPLHPKLGNLLESTQNIGVYQESYLTISKELAKFTPVEAVSFLKCISGDSILLTKRGPQKIKDINPKKHQKVLTVDEKGNFIYADLTNVWSSGVKKIYRVWTSKGYFIDCTMDHKLFTQDGWKEVKNLKLNIDFLTITNKYTTTPSDALNTNKSLLLSYVISEGSFVDSRKAVSIVNKDGWTINVIRNAIISEFGTDSHKEYVHKTTGCTMFTLKGNASQFIKNNLKPSKSRYKYIPDIITRGSTAVTTPFIGSFFNAEGTVGPININFSSTSFDIVRMLQILLLKYHLYSSIHICDNTYKNEPYRSYKLFLTDPHDIIRFASIFKPYINSKKNEQLEQITLNGYSNSRFLVPSGYMRAISNSIIDMNGILGVPDGTVYAKNITYDKAHRYQQFIKSELLQNILDADYKFCKVTKIEELGEEEVYDFSVDKYESCFVNGILTHNCISKKKTDLMAKFKDKFIQGCIKNGLTEEDATAIFEIMEAGQRYAFNKSHAVAYAVDALMFSAYQKSHFPRAFFLAELVYAKNTEEIGDVLNDALNFKVNVCKPDLRLMNEDFILTNKCIHYGIGRIKGFGQSKLKKLLAGVNDPSNMTWLELMMALYNSGSDAAAALIYSGAMDFTLLTRSRMTFELNVFSRLNEKHQAYVIKQDSLLKGLTDIVDGGSGKGTLCSSKTSLERTRTLLNELNNPPKSLRDTPNQIFDWEIQYLGYAFTLSEVDESLSNCSCDDFLNGKTLKRYIIGGTIIRIKTIITKGKDPQEMAFVEFKDSSNKISGVAFPAVWVDSRQKLYEGNKLMFFGTRGKKDSFVIEKVMQL